MKNSILILVAIAIMLNLSGCATIFSGGRDEITLDSEPPGAEVKANGKIIGTTPMTINAKKGKEYRFEFSKAGYLSKVFNLEYSLGAGWLFLDILTGIISIAVDAATGNWHEFETNEYVASLVKK